MEYTVVNLHSEKNLLEYNKGKIVKRDSQLGVVTDIQGDTVTRITSGEGDNVYRVVVMDSFHRFIKYR